MAEYIGAGEDGIYNEDEEVIDAVALKAVMGRSGRGGGITPKEDNAPVMTRGRLHLMQGAFANALHKKKVTVDDMAQVLKDGMEAKVKGRPDHRTRLTSVALAARLIGAIGTEAIAGDKSFAEEEKQRLEDAKRMEDTAAFRIIERDEAGSPIQVNAVEEYFRHVQAAQMGVPVEEVPVPDLQGIDKLMPSMSEEQEEDTEEDKDYLAEYTGATVTTDVGREFRTNVTKKVIGDVIPDTVVDLSKIKKGEG